MGTVNLGAFFKLIRIEYSLFAAFGVIIGGLLAGDLVGFQPEYVVAFFIIFFCATGNFAFNDYYDEDKDRVSHPARPAPKGLISSADLLRLALCAGAACLVSTFVLSGDGEDAALNSTGVVLMLGGVWLYSPLARIAPVLKNLAAAALSVAPILLALMLAEALTGRTLLLLAALLYVAARELLMDILDIEADVKPG